MGHIVPSDLTQRIVKVSSRTKKSDGKSTASKNVKSNDQSQVVANAQSQPSLDSNADASSNGTPKESNESIIVKMDIIDEAIFYFRANVFFKEYTINSDSDRVLIYVTLYIIECLKKLLKIQTKDAALKELYSLAISQFDIPGDPGFPFNSVYSKPKDQEEADLLRQYFQQLRQETGSRLVEKVFDTPDGKPSKWWLCFAKRRFINYTLTV